MKFFKMIKIWSSLGVVNIFLPLVAMSSQELSLDVHLVGTPALKHIEFTGSPSLKNAWQLAKLNAETARITNEQDSFYHINTAVVYCLYILKNGKNEKFYVEAKKLIINLFETYSVSLYLAEIAYFLLSFDSEFSDLYEREYQVEGISYCSIS